MIKILAGSKFPHTVAISSEESISPHNTYISVADWCKNLIGEMDDGWILYWDEVRGMTWAFKDRTDAKFFNYTWGERSK
jgi:hypothetical protein